MYNGANKRNEQTGSINVTGVENVKLTARQQLFCEYYLQTGCRNSAEAIRQAGYEGKNPYVAASVMLRHANVKKYLYQRKKRMLQEAGVNAYNILIEVASIAFSDIRELYNEDGTLKNIKKLPKHIAAAIESIESEEIIDPMTGEIIGVTKKVKLNSKLKALEMLMRYKGLLGEKEKDKILNLNNFNVTLDLGNGKPTLKLNTE